jgi:hypothetical protein
MAASRERSITRTPCGGSRSLIVTTTERPVASSVTRTRVPSGSVACAAVIAFSLNVSPLAVRLAWKRGPYQDASPLSMTLGSVSGWALA